MKTEPIVQNLFGRRRTRLETGFLDRFNIRLGLRPLKLALFLPVLMLLVTCKKGEDDPIFSLRSRKARLAGEWRLQTAQMVIGTTDLSSGTKYNQSFVIKGGQYTLTYSSPSGPVESKGTYVLNMNFSKDGRFLLNERVDTYILEATGNWDFNSGTGKKKSKSEVVFTIGDVTVGNTGGYHLINQGSTNFFYQIKELRDKKMVLEVATLVYEDKQGPKQDFNGELVFIQ